MGQHMNQTRIYVDPMVFIDSVHLGLDTLPFCRAFHIQGKPSEQGHIWDQDSLVCMISNIGCLLSREISSCLTVSTSSVEVGQGGCLLLVPAVASAILLFLSDEMDRGREPHYVVHAGERWVQEMSSPLELQCYSVPGMHPCRCCMTSYM